MDRKMLLTIDKMVVTRIPRFRVMQEDINTWTLHIDAVTREDRGQYMCQVNTEPMVSQVGYLDVVGEWAGVGVLDPAAIKVLIPTFFLLVACLVSVFLFIPVPA